MNTTDIFTEVNTMESTFIGFNSTTTMPSVPRKLGPNNQKIAIAVTVSFLMISANVISLVAFIIEKKLRTYNNYFIINLVISDLVAGMLLTITVAHTIIGYFPFSMNFCRVYTALRNASTTVSNLGMVVICVDRYRATFDPINHFTSRSKRKAVVMNGIAWAIGLGFWLSYATGWDFVANAYNTRHCVPGYSFRLIPAILPIFLQVFLPLAVVSFLYLKIYMKIKKTMRGRNVSQMFNLRSCVQEESAISNASIITIAGRADLPKVAVGGMEKDIGKSLQGTLEANDKQRKTPKKKTESKSTPQESTGEMGKATRTLLFIIISFFVAWIPSSIVAVIFTINPILLHQGFFTSIWYIFVAWLTYANSFLNPIAYSVSQPLFRKTVFKILFHPLSACRK
ncbi:muscarinic acetylcholine receptor M3-like [Strongylocentrotus purpuratus]|uniref:G-protein coupled receptors family 1 profile domain-containing protein n=1 Tax=Strongylocentrotus purpuratus TaxID=7668 RepID=A0A7M7PR63_STRPU|nr:muscarinic acetylcholine receptor M3-like [Strongylocentrotus purpuratus]